ncbi:VPS35 endosomal protein-sorting factor-like isoform X1 [Palaemon carinicauda]|uniref:VPS35 endosomal protein-sorting factor-like isoform X1 n=1 Tax=Palaemon carinicauda TaxID=392227 RepID=UPI0035B65B0E
MAITWKVVARQWDVDKQRAVLKPATSHPLQGVKDRGMVQTAYSREKKMKKSISQQFINDPLSAILDGPDPLSDLLSAPDPLSAQSGPAGSRKNLDASDDSALNASESRKNSWEQQKAFLLANFTTTATLTFTSSFLQPAETTESRIISSQRRVVKTQTSVPDRSKTQGMSGSERIRARLEQLDSLDDAGGGLLREVGGLTQSEFILRLTGLKMELTQAWNTDHRVKALKIAIQCVKLLSLSAPEHFYPMKFALVMDILDTLASLVYERLQQKSKKQVSTNGGSDYGLLEAQETARNWFYKVASIRELLPRLYLEASLLPCYSILSVQEGEEAMSRLTRMIRGIGDPLIAAYARMFLCRVGVEVAPRLTHYITENIEDFLLTLKQGLWPEGEADVNMGEDKDALALRVLSPPLEWMLQCLASRAPHHVLQTVFEYCGGEEGLGQNLLVAALLTTFPHNFISNNALPLTHLIAGCSYPGKSQHELVSSLGVCVNDAAPAPQQHLPLLNAVWKLVTRIPLTKDYLSTAGIWLEFTAKHFTAAEVNTLLGDVLKRVRSAHNQEQVPYPVLLKLISTALTNSPDPQSLFPMANFQGVLSVFQRDSVSAGDGVTWGVTEALLNNHPGAFTDPTLVQHLLTLCGALHDSINALTTDDERRQLSHLITTFIRQVDFGRDFEQQLDFYVNARASFSNLDTVLRALVQCVCRLAMATWSVMRSQHTGKTAAFVRACAAYCFITIPSLSMPSIRLKLYLLSGTVALLNGCLGQGDACMKAAIREVLEMAGSQDAETSSQLSESLRSSVSSLASTLIATPDPPDAAPPLYLLRGLTNAVRSYQWPKDTDLQAYLSLSLLNAISASAQDTLPYNIHSVEGNDALYGGDPMVQQEAEQLCTSLLQDILTHIQGLSGVNEKRVGPLAMNTLWSTVTWCDLSQVEMMNTAVFLWSLMLKHSSPQPVAQTKNWLSKRAQQLKDPFLEQLVKHVNLAR